MPIRPLVRISRVGAARHITTLAVATVSALTLACSSSERKAADDAGTPAHDSATTATGVTPAGTPACPMEGDWTPCAVEERLTRSGVVFDRQPDQVTYPFFTVPATVYHIGTPDHEVQVFLYPSATERERDTAALDSATVSPKGTRHSWPTPPVLVTSNNLAAVILSLNDRTVERLALALGAGLPQPEKR